MIHFIPHLETELWSRKSIRSFECIEDLREHIAYHMTLFRFFIGKDKLFRPADVQFSAISDHEPVTGWRNYREILLDGDLIGYCGE